MFSQFQEEEIIIRFFGDRIGCFLDIGAWDGISLSNTRALAISGWSGLLVEPDPNAFSKLIQNCLGLPKLVCVNAAVAARRTLRKFYFQNEWGGTLNPTMIQTGSRKAFADAYVLTVSPSDLIEIGNLENMKFDFVSLDAEWMDYEILQAFRGMLDATELLCVEINDYKFAPTDETPALCKEFGFTKTVGTTLCNLIVSR